MGGLEYQSLFITSQVDSRQKVGSYLVNNLRISSWVNRGHRNGTISIVATAKGHGTLSKFKIGKQASDIAEIQVEPEVGLHVLECAKNNPILGIIVLCQPKSGKHETFS